MIKLALRSLYISTLTLILTINVLYFTNTVTLLNGYNPTAVDFNTQYFGFSSIYTGLQSFGLKPLADGFSEYINSVRHQISDIFNNVPHDYITKLQQMVHNKQYFGAVLESLQTLGKILYMFVLIIWLPLLSLAYVTFMAIYIFIFFINLTMFYSHLPEGLHTL